MQKIYILYIAAISIISLVYINNTSALDYSSNVGIGFTFNPTLSISISPSDLIIDNLIPGSTLDSNGINVSVTTNAAYGYTLSANVGDDIHNNSNLTHTNNTSIFSSIATNANLTSLEDSEDSNIWGYSYKNNTLVSPAWSNYNGLSNSSNAILLDNSNAADSTGSVDFKISAKASNTQPSGTYTGTINFTAVTKVAPMSLLDSFIASGAEQLNGYYKMQDMTHDICESVDVEESELQLIDVRDNKVYWVAKLKDGNCWMTQNLDLDLDSNKSYTHYDTDLGWDNSNSLDENATWKPINSTSVSTNSWLDSNTEPSSFNPGEKYYYTSNSDASDIQYNSLQKCGNAGHNDCMHYHSGNYYNWSAAVASNDTSSLISSGDAPNSICPSEWRLPSITNKEFENVLIYQGIAKKNSPGSYSSDGFNKIRSYPIYLTRAGNVRYDGRIISFLSLGYYWGSTIDSATNSYGLLFSGGYIRASRQLGKTSGFVVRCLAR